ncbi:carbohydrate binding family 9 domain-containing protein [Flagellimonas meridianipacifica]|uniref:Carbohydrate binding protein with CBM9 domain n=1 Tax=Flagellimonas meridianipacifica TaxID=1080225 RepID=A0A2T0M9T6_9FLAO|nr:carbohydrate binding family 9 domain-containing protein [Allomuricauda pacifica]PRX54274.1 carbohydrate binding protein with CBM9 domain [Allomuricauda pacifica]
MHRNFVFILFLLLTLCPTLGQESIKAFRASRTSNSVQLDGELTEGDWKKAQTISDFTQIEPRPGAPATFATEVKCLFDEKNLYFGIICYDTVGSKNYKAPNLQRDFNFLNHDLVGITIDGFNDKRNSITFFTNTYGAQRDYQSFDDTYFDVAWNGLWQVKTTSTDGAWIAEFRIPWKTLRYRFIEGEAPRFGINFQRVQRSANEKSAWSAYPRSVGFNRMEFTGKLENVDAPVQKINLQVNPYFLVNQRNKGQTDVKTGGELKWAPTPNLVVDATVNTDFAQADVDQIVNNLSRFSVLFPERRQFFLENASLFSIGLQGGENSFNGGISLFPFFSRRIGLDGTNQPVPLNFGGRSVYRSKSRNIGALFIQQAATDELSKTNFAVFRYQENIGRYGRLGFLGTNRRADQNSSTIALDGFFRMGEKHLVNFLASYAEEEDSGFAGYVQYRYISDRVLGWFTSTLVEDTYNPSVGFVSRDNVIGNTAGIELNLRGKWIPFPLQIRDLAPRISADFYHDPATGNLQERKLFTAPLQINYISGARTRLFGEANRQVLNTSFTPLGLTIAPGDYKYVLYGVDHASDASKKLSFLARYNTGGFYDGELQQYGGRVNYSPLPHASFEMVYEHNDFSNFPSQVVAEDVSLLQFNARFALNPQLQLTSFFQKNTLNDQTVWNSRLAWEYSPLSFFYIVINNNDSDFTGRNNDLIFKINFLKQF